MSKEIINRFGSLYFCFTLFHFLFVFVDVIIGAFFGGGLRCLFNIVFLFLRILLAWFLSKKRKVTYSERKITRLFEMGTYFQSDLRTFPSFYKYSLPVLIPDEGKKLNF